MLSVVYYVLEPITYNIYRHSVFCSHAFRLGTQLAATIEHAVPLARTVSMLYYANRPARLGTRTKYVGGIKTILLDSIDRSISSIYLSKVCKVR